MAEYIEREELWKILNDLGGCGAAPDTWANGWDKAIDTAIEELGRTPAADVRPERHGHIVWKERHSGGFRTVKCLYEFPDIIKENNISCKHIAKFDDRCTIKEAYCSECGKRLGDFISFCGNCGAKMDGEDGNENE